MPSFGPPDHSRGTRTIVFDGDYIRDELLPRFTSRYLNSERYGVRISNEEGVIFFKNDFKPQVTTRMFSFRPDCFNDRRGPRREGHRGPPWLEGSASLIARNDVTCTDAPNRRDPGRWVVEAGLTQSCRQWITGISHPKSAVELRCPRRACDRNRNARTLCPQSAGPRPAADGIRNGGIA